LRARLTTFALTALVAFASLASASISAAATSPVHWNPPSRIDSRNGGLTAVACASPKLCVAVDESGFALTTTNPRGHGGKWSRPFRIDAGPNAPLTGVACPSTKLCVAIDSAGNVITSKHPNGGSRAWSRPVHVDTATAPDGGPAGLNGISCPSITLCVAVDGASPANTVSSTTPTLGTTAWKSVAVGGLLTSINCPSITLCVAAGSQHYYSTTPTASASWHATGIETAGGVFSDIACPSITLCLASGYGNTSTGLVTSTLNPKGPGSAWSTASVEPNPPTPGSGLIDTIGCMSTSVCIATDSADNAYVSNNPTSGMWTGPTAFARKSSPTVTWSSIGCTVKLCVAVDSNGWAATVTGH
jgi:hypothetical protein